MKNNKHIKSNLLEGFSNICDFQNHLAKYTWIAHSLSWKLKQNDTNNALF